MGQLVIADRAHTAALDDGRFGRHGLPTSGWHAQHWLWPAHYRAIHRQRRTAQNRAAAPLDKRGASAGVAPKTLRPTGCAGRSASRRSPLVEKTNQEEQKPNKTRNAITWKLGRFLPLTFFLKR